MQIYLAFDMDYPEDYEVIYPIFEAIQDTPVVLFIVGSRHPKEPIPLHSYVELGNHSFDHKEWYDETLEDIIKDMEKNHEFIKNLYGVEPKVYRSPHLRYIKEVDQEMQLRGYLPEMKCAECPHCLPITENLRTYFSSHHHFFNGFRPCGRDFLEMFQTLCEKGEDFTFFLDPHDFVEEERLTTLKHLIKIGNDFGKFSVLSKNKKGL